MWPFALLALACVPFMGFATSMEMFNESEVTGTQYLLGNTSTKKNCKQPSTTYNAFPRKLMGRLYFYEQTTWLHCRISTKWVEERPNSACWQQKSSIYAGNSKFHFVLSSCQRKKIQLPIFNLASLFIMPTGVYWIWCFNGSRIFMDRIPSTSLLQQRTNSFGGLFPSPLNQALPG